MAQGSDCTEVINVKNAEGKYAFTVIEFSLKDNTIMAHYPKILKTEEIENEEGEKLTKTYMSVRYAIILSGTQTIEPQFIGDLEEIFDEATEVKGQTFVVKDIIKGFGFRKWDNANKSWLKR